MGEKRRAVEQQCSDDEVKLAVAPCGSSEKNCRGWEGVLIFQSVCADRPQENDWMTGVWMTCVLVADVTWVKRLDVELVADLGEAILVFSAGEGARCRWCVTRYLVELCCVVGSRWLLELVWYASVEWMWWGCCLPSWSYVVVVRVSRWLICPRPLVIGRLCVP